MGIIDTGTPKPNPGPYEPGRRCAQRDCITVLSRYRPGPFCEVHTPDPDTPKVMRARLEWLAEQEAAA